MEIKRLKNGNVIFNNEEIEFTQLPRPIIIDMFAVENAGRGLPPNKKEKLTRDDYDALSAFFDYAKRNGYPFPTIPPKELFLRYEAEHTYYVYGEPYPREITRKRGVSMDDERILLIFHDFVKGHNLMTDREWERNVNDWRDILQNEIITETVLERKPVEKDGKLVIDRSQQDIQDENNKLIRKFYDWLAKSVK